MLLALVPVVLFLGVCAFGFAVSKSERSFPNVYVDSIPVGSMKKSEILQTLQSEGWQGRTARTLNVTTYDGVSIDVNPVEAGVLLDSASAAGAAVEFGKDSNIFRSISNYFSCLKQKTDINELNKAVNENYVNQKISSLQKKLDAMFDEDAYEIDKDAAELVIVKGYPDGLELNARNLAEQITSSLENGDEKLEYYGLASEPVCPDLSLLHDKVCTGPVDARFSDDGTHTVIERSPGYLFEVSYAEQLWNNAEPGEEIRIPLQLEYSDVTAEYLESMMYRDLLGAMTTKYNNSSENRSSNVRLATSLVNGSVIFPDEVFSFNDTVGKRTEEAGFLLAPAYAGYDDIKEEIGGGVCQVSTGIFASALFAFLDVTSHTCHVYPPNYIQLGTDATVSIPESGRTIDLKIRNNKSFPLKIVGYCEESEDPKTGKPSKTVTIEIWGTLEEDDYMPVEFDNRYGDIYDYDRKIEPAYDDREGYRIQFTHDETEFEDDTGKGLRTLTYRRVYDSSGTLVEKVILNPVYSFGYGMDTYYFMN